MMPSRYQQLWEKCLFRGAYIVLFYQAVYSRSKHVYKGTQQVRLLQTKKVNGITTVACLKHGTAAAAMVNDRLECRTPCPGGLHDVHQRLDGCCRWYEGGEQSSDIDINCSRGRSQVEASKAQTHSATPVGSAGDKFKEVVTFLKAEWCN